MLYLIFAIIFTVIFLIISVTTGILTYLNIIPTWISIIIISVFIFIYLIVLFISLIINRKKILIIGSDEENTTNSSEKRIIKYNQNDIDTLFNSFQIKIDEVNEYSKRLNSIYHKFNESKLSDKKLLLKLLPEDNNPLIYDFYRTNYVLYDFLNNEFRDLSNSDKKLITRLYINGELNSLNALIKNIGREFLFKISIFLKSVNYMNIFTDIFYIQQYKSGEYAGNQYRDYFFRVMKRLGYYIKDDDEIKESANLIQYIPEKSKKIVNDRMEDDNNINDEKLLIVWSKFYKFLNEDFDFNYAIETLKEDYINLQNYNGKLIGFIDETTISSSFRLLFELKKNLEKMIYRKYLPKKFVNIVNSLEKIVKLLENKYGYKAPSYNLYKLRFPKRPQILINKYFPF